MSDDERNKNLHSTSLMCKAGTWRTLIGVKFNPAILVLYSYNFKFRMTKVTISPENL